MVNTVCLSCCGRKRPLVMLGTFQELFCDDVYWLEYLLYSVLQQTCESFCEFLNFQRLYGNNTYIGFSLLPRQWTTHLQIFPLYKNEAKNIRMLPSCDFDHVVIGIWPIMSQLQLSIMMFHRVYRVFKMNIHQCDKKKRFETIFGDKIMYVPSANIEGPVFRIYTATIHQGEVKQTLSVFDFLLKMITCSIPELLTNQTCLTLPLSRPRWAEFNGWTLGKLIMLLMCSEVIYSVTFAD